MAYTPNLLSLLTAFLLTFSVVATPAMAADDHGHDEPHTEAAHAHEGADQDSELGFNPSEEIFGHILDSHEWHITDIGETPIALHLPFILYNSNKGFEFFTVAGHDHHEYMHNLQAKGYYIDKATNSVKSIKDKDAMVIDFSITKTVLQMIMVAVLMFFMFTSVAKAYKKREGQAPKGFQSLIEPVITFVRDDIARPNLGDKTKKYLPYLLTVFFFIWISNLFGLTPFNSNIMGNISVTAALAVVTLFYIIISTNGAYWSHIFWFPGVPVPVKFIMLPVELLGVFTKPFALMVRLFANITAGHFMVISLVMLIFILSKGGKQVGVGAGAAVFSVAFTLFIMVIEVLVAALQAYVFTILSAVFIAQAFEHGGEEHH